MKFHTELNPKLWTEDNELKSEVRDKLLEIANAFIEFLEIPENAIKDIRLTGSSANYNYTKYSDIDVHLIVDYEKVHKDCPIVQGYLWAFKTLFNNEHDISIYDIPVEVYTEDVREPGISNGIYSLKDDEWLSIPEKIEIDVDDNAVKKKHNEFAEAIDKIDDSEKAANLLLKIYNMRKAGLSEEGEFSVENLAFKQLRNEKLIDKLWDLKKKDIDKKLSLESFNRLNERIEKAEIQYGGQLIDTVISFNPSASELEGLLNKYKALRVLVAKEPGTYKEQVICMPAASGDHGLLAKWLLMQGYEINRNTFYHIVKSNEPYLTLDSFYINDTEKLAQELTDELKSVTNDDSDNEIEKMIEDTYYLIGLLPLNVNSRALEKALSNVQGIDEEVFAIMHESKYCKLK